MTALIRPTDGSALTDTAATGMVMQLKEDVKDVKVEANLLVVGN
jgi:hypothetical protein